MKTRRSVAIVGAGVGAEHLRGYRRLPERFTVSMICDLDPAKAERLATESAGIDVTTDFAAVLDSEIDVVDICLPPHLHLGACVAALDAGKHVVCEKPLVASLAEADTLAEHVASSPGSLFPVFQYRYGIGAAQFRSLAGAGLIGTPYAATLETHWNRGTGYYAVDWRGTWGTERGGAILGHAIHIHDLVMDLLGPAESVFALLDTRVNDIEVEDCAALTVRLSSGALVTSSVTLGAAADISRLRLVCEHVTVESSHLPYSPAAEPWTFTARNPDRQAEIDQAIAAVGDTPTGYVGLFTAIADALDGQAGAEVTLDHARRSLEFVTGVYASARSGQPVSFPLTRDHPLYHDWVPS